MEEAQLRFGRIDILHYNVGLSIAGGDAPPTEITEEAFDRIVAINLRGAVMACKHVLPIMRAQRAGVILTISSLAAWEQYPYVTYKATKSALIAYTQQLAIQNAEYGIRANVILPGLMDTPMAVDTRAKSTGKSRAEVARHARRQSAAAQAHGHRLGRCQRGAVPGERRGELHHRRRAAGRRRHVGEGGVVLPVTACGLTVTPCS
jgi:NAD(P)-dependent dehydrogenase (short-subunit alcohol dehydrogenase family)